jgi:phospholipase/lecithinase/hemolysin
MSGATSGDILNVQIPLYRPGTNAPGSLFVVWSYENDFNNVIFIKSKAGVGTELTNAVFWSNIIAQTVSNTSNSVVALYRKGARSMVVPNMIGYDDVLANGTYYKAPDGTRSILGTYSKALNEQLAQALGALENSLPDLRLFRLNFHDLIHASIDSYQTLGFTKADVSALDDPALTDKSFTGAGRDYLWWDQLHPTTKFHQLWARWIFDLVTKSVVERLQAVKDQRHARLKLQSLFPGRTYILQSSSDLQVWRDTLAFTARAGTNDVSPDIMPSGATFFRVGFAVEEAQPF